MTTPSVLSSNGLSIIVNSPLRMGLQQVGEFSADINSYNHAISAVGGFSSASFTMTGNSQFLEDWLSRGLGRHIQVFGPSGNIIWEGYVNQVDVNYGSATFSVGPLTNVANRVMAWYTQIWWIDVDSVYTKVTGTTFPTVLVEDLDSQYRFGIWEKILNLGELTDDEAEYVRDLYLAENAYPESNPSLSLTSGSGEASVTVQCRGYIDWLNNYVYEDLDANQSIYLSTMIRNILTSDPNNIISSSYDKIDENLYLYDSHQEDNKLSKTIIDDIVTLGDANDNRWTFGVYANQKAVYSAVPTSVEYLYYKEGKTQQVETIYGVKVNPWDVVPCKWVGIPDFLSGSTVKIESPRTDPRVFFAEEVTYTAPDQVTISGAKVRKLSQYLAKKGLGGV